MEGKIQKKIISIVIDPCSNYSYISPKLIDKCGLGKELDREPWKVQLDTDTRRRIIHWVKSCAMELSGIPTTSHLNVLSLGGYGILLGMDFLYL